MHTTQRKQCGTQWRVVLLCVLHSLFAVHALLRGCAPPHIHGIRVHSRQLLTGDHLLGAGWMNDAHWVA